MKLFALLTVLVVVTLRSDIARVYPNGKELAIGGQTGGQPYPAGKEPTITAKGDDRGHDDKDDRTR